MRGSWRKRGGLVASSLVVAAAAAAAANDSSNPQHLHSSNLTFSLSSRPAHRPGGDSGCSGGVSASTLCPSEQAASTEAAATTSTSTSTAAPSADAEATAPAAADSAFISSQPKTIPGSSRPAGEADPDRQGGSPDSDAGGQGAGSYSPKGNVHHGLNIFVRMVCVEGVHPRGVLQRIASPPPGPTAPG